MQAMTDRLVVPTAAFSIDDPWALPAACTPVPLRRATDGGSPRLGTTVAAYHDDETLTLLFHFDDDEIVATLYDHDAPLYTEDVVEAFLAPERLEEYFELEVNPLGTTFDARITSPDGIRATMRADLAWTCDDFAAVLRTMIDGDQLTVDAVLRIPFASLGRSAPASGETWRANFFRIDRSEMYGDDYSAWQPTMKTPPDFHLAAAFGTLVFE